MTLPNDVAPPSAIVILTSADLTLDTNGRDSCFKFNRATLPFLIIDVRHGDPPIHSTTIYMTNYFHKKNHILYHYTLGNVMRKSYAIKSTFQLQIEKSSQQIRCPFCQKIISTLHFNTINDRHQWSAAI